MKWYWRYLVKKPGFCILAIATFCCASIILSLFQNLPNFSDPTLGFETRGTTLGNRLVTWHNLLQETGLTKTLAANPSDLYFATSRFLQRQQKIYNKHKKRRKYNKIKDRTKQKNGKFTKYDATNNSHKILIKKDLRLSTASLSYASFDQTNFYSNMVINDNKTLHPQRRSLNLLDDHKEFANLKGNRSVLTKPYFCDAPNKMFAHFAVKHKVFNINRTKSLFDLDSLLALCQIQEQITNVPNYKEYCQRDTLNNCCQPWSLANYAAFLANKISCYDLTNNNVRYMQNLLLNCFEYYRDYNSKNDDCIKLDQCVLPEECAKNNLAFNVFQYLIDDNFIQAEENAKYMPPHSLIFIPVVRSPQILPLYHEWQRLELNNQFVQVVGMDLGLENELFNELLMSDAWLIALGGIFIMLCMWLYTSSIFLTIMTCTAVIFSIGLAYFIYTVVLNMSFFPYMNLLAVVVIVGIGADDAFIFIKIWHCISSDTRRTSLNGNEMIAQDIKMNSRKTVGDVMILTVQHAIVSMFVTTITTAGAFFASYTSHITAVKCFSIFAATAVITNYLLMLTWLPASLSYMECIKLKCSSMNQLQTPSIEKLMNKTIYSLTSLLENYLIGAIFNNAFIFILVFGSFGIIGMIIVLYKPGLQLPETSHIQLFASHHPFEMYHSELKQRFWFEKTASVENSFKMPIYFVWGLKHIDDGDYTNPFAYGSLKFDDNFVIYTKAAQEWILKFCENLKKQPFYEVSFGQYLPGCFMENFVTLMNRACFNSMDETDHTPCCNMSTFPYEKDIFELCLPQIMSLLYNTPRKYFVPSVAGPRFMVPPKVLGSLNNSSMRNASVTSLPDNTPPLVKIIVIEIESNFFYTTKYDEVKKFVRIIEEWFNHELKSAPYELQNGWFISDLKFFDLQNSLYNGTLLAIAVAMCISMVVLLFFTCNILIAFYAVVTILLAIFVTIAILVLLGWKLNILESITVSAAIGLTVDFSLHYGIHYRLSPSSDRLGATRFAITRIISPTAMAAFTTAIPGILVLFSNVLPYIQIGTFLLVMMATSWTYATFFLMSLLKLYGPQNNFMEFSHLVKWKIFRNNAEEVKCNGNQLLSPNGLTPTNVKHSELHEMEQIATPINEIE